MIYLLCLDQAFRHARHYMGWCEEGTLERRLERHGTRRGAVLLRHVRAAGIAWHLARTWPGGDRTLERTLKNQKNAPRLCPLCRERKRGGGGGA